MTKSSDENHRKTLLAPLAKWLRVWAEMWPKTVSEELVEIYLAAVAELSPAQLEAACRLATKECRFFPVPADILDRAGQQPRQFQAMFADARRVHAETEWDAISAARALKGCLCPILGEPNDRWPKLTAAGEYAVRIAGGWQAICETLQDHDAQRVHWITKAFVDAHIEHQQTDGLKALPRTEAQRLLERVTPLLEE